MTDKTAKQVWFITGASRGMGVDFAKVALTAGHAVVATGRDTDAVAKAVGKWEDLLVVKLDVGADAIGTAEQKVADLQAQIDAYRELSTSLALDELTPAGSAR